MGIAPSKTIEDRKVHECDKHEPGTRSCYVHCLCRCYSCTFEVCEYERRRQREIAYGRWQPYVDAEPVRRHVRSLMASEVGASDGVGWKRIAHAAGVPESTVWKLLYGDPQRGQEPSKRCRPRTAEKLLAVDRSAMADGATVPAEGTWKRLNEMIEAGFAKAELGRLIHGPDAKALQLSRKLVQVGNARRVAHLHKLWKDGQLEPHGRCSRWCDHDPEDVHAGV